MIYAIILGKADTVRELIKKVADVNKTVTNQNLVTVQIITASSSGNIDVLRELIKNDEDIKINIIIDTIYYWLFLLLWYNAWYYEYIYNKQQATSNKQQYFTTLTDSILIAKKYFIIPIFFIGFLYEK